MKSVSPVPVYHKNTKTVISKWVKANITSHAFPQCKLMVSISWEKIYLSILRKHGKKSVDIDYLHVKT